jgi:hypothetical protein
MNEVFEPVKLVQRLIHMTVMSSEWTPQNKSAENIINHNQRFEIGFGCVLINNICIINYRQWNVSNNL